MLFEAYCLIWVLNVCPLWVSRPAPPPPPQYERRLRHPQPHPEDELRSLEEHEFRSAEEAPALGGPMSYEPRSPGGYQLDDEEKPKATSLNIAWDAKDYWAYAIKAQKTLPPLEYDHPAHGRVEVRQAETVAILETWCGLPGPIMGCARRIPEWGPEAGQIMIAPQAQLDQFGFTYNMVLRHERGHINGWPSDHRGVR